MRRLLLLGAVAVAASASLMTAAAAQEDAPLASTRLSITLENSPRAEIADSIAARLTDADGTPLGNSRVEFWLGADFLGDRYVFIGEAQTDASGVARVQLEPHKEMYEARATFDGDEEHAATEATAQLRFRTQRVVTFAEGDPTQLGGLRVVMPRVMGVVVGVLWVMLLGLWFVTVRMIRRAGEVTEAPVEAGSGVVGGS